MFHEFISVRKNWVTRKKAHSYETKTERFSCIQDVTINNVGTAENIDTVIYIMRPTTIRLIIMDVKKIEIFLVSFIFFKELRNSIQILKR